MTYLESRLNHTTLGHRLGGPFLMNNFYTLAPRANRLTYLRQPLNDGHSYTDYSGCMCQKGAFFASCIGLNERDFVLNPEFNTDENIDHHKKFEAAVRDFCGMLAIHNPDLLLALDIAEYIHMSGYPQKAKIYLLYVLEKFNLDSVSLPTVIEGSREKLCMNNDRNFYKGCDVTTRQMCLIPSVVGRGWMSPSWMKKIRRNLKTDSYAA